MESINFDEIITVDNEPVQIVRDKDASLGDLCRLAINKMRETDNLPLEEALKRGRLSMRIAKGGAQALAAEEVALIKKMLPVVLTHPELIVIVCDLIDPPKG